MGLLDLLKSCFNTTPQTTIKSMALRNCCFRVSGVTFGKRQEFFDKAVKYAIKNEYIEPYAGKTNKEILEDNDSVYEAEYMSFPSLRLEPTEVKGKDAIEVYVKGFDDEKETMIGYVEKEHIEEVLYILELKQNNPTYRIEASNFVIGGNVKEVDDYSDEPVIKEDKINYGLSISLLIYEK